MTLHQRRKTVFWNNSTAPTLFEIECASSQNPHRVQMSQLWRKLLWRMVLYPAVEARPICQELLSCLHQKQHPAAHLVTDRQNHIWIPRLTPPPHPRITLHLSQEVWLTNLCLLLANGTTLWVGQGIQLKKMLTPPVSQRKTRPQGEQLDNRSPRERQQTKTWRLSLQSRSRTGELEPPLHLLLEAILSPSPTWRRASPLMLWDKEQVRSLNILRSHRLKTAFSFVCLCTRCRGNFIILTYKSMSGASPHWVWI